MATPKKTNLYDSFGARSGRVMGQLASDKNTNLQPYWTFDPYFNAMAAKKVWILPCTNKTELKNNALPFKTTYSNKADFKTALQNAVSQATSTFFDSGVLKSPGEGQAATCTIDAGANNLFGARVIVAMDLYKHKRVPVKVEFKDGNTVILTLNVICHEKDGEFVCVFPVELQGNVTVRASSDLSVVFTANEIVSGDMAVYVEGLNYKDLPGVMMQQGTVLHDDEVTDAE